MTYPPQNILINAIRANVRLRLMVVCSLALLLSFIVIGDEPAKSSPHEDQLWRENHRIDTGRSDAAGGPRSYRAVTLNEKAQRELLRHAPMEFSKAAERDRLVMTLPMPDGKLQSQPLLHSLTATLPAATGDTLRTYRLALAASAEYTQMYGGGEQQSDRQRKVISLGKLRRTLRAQMAVLFL